MKKTFKYLIPTILASGMLFGCATNTPSGPVDTTVHVTGISLDCTSKAVTVGDSFTLKATVAPNDATNKDVTWSSSNDTFATVSEAGVVSALKDGTVNITATTVDGGFTATCAVTVNPKVETKIKAYIHDPRGLIKEIAEKNSRNDYVVVTDKAVEDGVTYYNLTSGRDVRVKLATNGYIVPTALEINGEEHAIKDGYVNFTADPGDYDFLSLTPKYRDDTPITKDYALVIENTGHLTLKTYSDADCKTETNSANQGDVIYVKAISGSDDYFCREVSYKRITNDTGNIDTATAQYDANSDVFSFTVPYSYDKKITITATEGNASLLKDNKVVGEYLTVWLTQATFEINNFESNKNIFVNKDGSIVRYKADGTVGSSTQVISFTSTTLKTENYSDLLYGDKYILVGDDFKSPFNNYDSFGVKKSDASDSDSDYSVSGERFTLNGNKYTLIQVFFKDKNYSNFLLNYTTKVIYEDVAVDILLGDKVNDEKTMYVVSKDDSALISVSYYGDGGYSNRISMESPLGKYVNGENVLLIANSGYSYYNGVGYVSSINNSTITLSNSKKRIVLEINTDTKEFTVTSETDITSSIPNLRGLSFKGTYIDLSYEPCKTGISITFNEYENDNEIIATMQEDSYSAKYWAKFTVSYDLDTNIITLTLFEQKYNWPSIGQKTRAQMSEGKMVILDQYYNTMDTRNSVLTCAGFHL